MGASWSTQPLSLPKAEDSPLHLITNAAASLRLSPATSLSSVEAAFQNLLTSHSFWDGKLPVLDPVPFFDRLWHKIVSDAKAVHYQCCSANFAFINQNPSGGTPESEKSTNDQTGRRNLGGTPKSEKSTNDQTGRRNLTNVLLVINVICFAAQVASEGRLLLWGAKINSLIEKGQLWRLITSSMLHANLIHLLVNCYSLSSVGPTVEKLCGPNRFLAVYAISAITSSATSYLFCKSPSVGASGAIFGLVGCTAVFIARHRELMGGGNEQMMHIGQVILINMAIGLMANGIDNWGHLGGLIGGAATSWFLGPAWKLESSSYNGKRVFVDKAPIRMLSNLPNQYLK